MVHLLEDGIKRSLALLLQTQASLDSVRGSDGPSTRGRNQAKPGSGEAAPAAAAAKTATGQCPVRLQETGCSGAEWSRGPSPASSSGWRLHARPCPTHPARWPPLQRAHGTGDPRGSSHGGAATAAYREAATQHSSPAHAVFGALPGESRGAEATGDGAAHELR